MAAKKPVKQYKHYYETTTQKVSKDGSEVRMQNGHVFKRTVLPSVAEAKAVQDKDWDKLVDELEDGTIE